MLGKISLAARAAKHLRRLPAPTPTLPPALSPDPTNLPHLPPPAHGDHTPRSLSFLRFATSPASTSQAAESPRGMAGPVSTPSVDDAEVSKFHAMAAQWWNVRGPHAMLHRMSPVRVSFIRSGICRHFQRSEEHPQPLHGLHVLDVGCGGGLLSEPLARLGATVTGIDVVPSNIAVAQEHARSSPSLPPISYECVSAEEVVARGCQFDVVTCLEVVEHVADPQAFLGTLSQLVKPKSGALFLSTINRTPRSLAAGILIAEYLLHWVPRGTHDWAKFLTPEEVAGMLRGAGPLKMQELAGITLHPLSLHWSLSPDTSVNYIAMASEAQ